MGIVPGWPIINVRIEDVDAGPGECWRVRTCRPDGYAQIRRPPLLVHRVAWEVHHGRRLEPGMEVHHECRTKNCVNPAHLVALSKEDHHALHHGVRTLAEPPAGNCKHGHLWAGFGQVNAQGRWICVECRRAAGRRYDHGKRRPK